LFDDPEFARSLDRQPVFAEKNNFLRDLRTDEPGQQHHDDACAELQFRLAKERPIARNGHVAGKAQLERAGKARTANRCNGRLRAMPEPHDRVEILAQDWLPLVEAGRPQFRLLLKVEPDEKAWPAPATTTTRTAVSRSARSIAPLISWSMEPFSALVRAGRDSVRWATESATR